MKLCFLIASCCYIDTKADEYDSHVMSFRYKESFYMGAVLIYQ